MTDCCGKSLKKIVAERKRTLLESAEPIVMNETTGGKEVTLTEETEQALKVQKEVSASIIFAMMKDAEVTKDDIIMATVIINEVRSALHVSDSLRVKAEKWLIKQEQKHAKG
jgi:ABC-type Na+ transport system ATPase subunit NatA